MATQLIKHERIETTLPKAKELRGFADRLITWGKQVCSQLHVRLARPLRLVRSCSDALQGDQSARRRAEGMLFDESAVHKLFTVMADRYRDREGGYTRILRSRIRQGDVAQMAYIEYVPQVNTVSAYPASLTSTSILVEPELQCCWCLALISGSKDNHSLKHLLCWQVCGPARRASASPPWAALILDAASYSKNSCGQLGLLIEPQLGTCSSTSIEPREVWESERGVANVRYCMLCHRCWLVQARVLMIQLCAVVQWLETVDHAPCMLPQCRLFSISCVARKHAHAHK